MITFRYKDGLSNISNNILNSIINFRFLSEKLYYHSDQLVFDGTNYIDTEVKLFSEENIHKNFEISFDITNINGTQTSQATVINSMLEKSPYPGFVFRFQTNGTHLEFNSPKIAHKAGINASTTNKIIIKRVNDIYYVQVNDNTPERIGTYSGTTFDETAVIGASIDGNGDPWRFFKGTLSNITITLSEPESYTVKFDANGGTGTMDEQNIRKDESVTLNKNTFEKEGQMLGSWNTKPDGSGTSYRNEEQVSNIANPGATVTLYAIWVDGIHYFVHFNENGGTGSMNNQELVYAINQNLDTNLFVREGYIFDHWNTKADGTGINYSQNQSVKNLTETENDIVDLYAIWYPLKYFYEGEYEFSGLNYINTGIYLFSSQTIDKDFDVSFEIVNRVSTGGQATMMSAMDESGSPWSGVVYRVQSNTQDNLAANATNSAKTDKKFSNNVSKVLLKKRNGILYMSLNDGADEQILDMTTLTTPFNSPLTFGCSLTSSGTPQRNFIGTLKNMKVKLYE